MKGVSELRLLIFFSMFVMFILYFEAESGRYLLKNADIENLPELSLSNPIAVIQYFILLSQVSSEYRLLNLVIIPMVIGLIYIIVKLIIELIPFT